MKKITLFLLVLAISVSMVFVFTAASLAGNPNGPAAVNGLNGKGTQHLELYEKDSNWDPVDKGANGRLTFSSSSFVFNGHKLEANTDYSLIVYVDPWPGSGSTLLAEGTTNGGGNINLSGDMPTVENAKVWLVLSDDFDGSKMTGWNPSEYLFEYNLISN